jgi:hypothetical protein
MPWVKSILVCIALLFALRTTSVRADGDPLGADEMAEAIISMTSRVWTGPRTAAPGRVERPREATEVLHSVTGLLAIHADPGTRYETMERALEALEEARSRLALLGWPRPMIDGTLGGDPGFDLYISRSRPRGAHTDGMVPWTYLDRASSFAVVDPATPSEWLAACVTAAYAEALLLSADPAEANTWRRATAAWLAWEITGRFGCEDAIHEQQAEPNRSWIADGAEDGAGGALLIAYMSARHGNGSTEFVRDVWDLARQRTWEGDDLRAEPDLWSAFDAAIELSGDRLLDNIVDLSVVRWFIGRTNGGEQVLDAIDSDARVPVMRRMTRLPSRVSAPEPLQTFGSAYVLIDSTVWGEARQLRAWLRGEFGVRWSFVAVQLDSSGVEQDRISAPPSSVTPKAYLPIELRPETVRLLFVVTHLGNELPDADEQSTDERSFELIVDRSD